MNNLKTQSFSRVISSLALSLCICSLWTPPVQAEGSRELTSSGGFRPFSDYRNDSLETGPILRQTVIQVYAEAGETLYLGSSAVGIGQGTINYKIAMVKAPAFQPGDETERCVEPSNFSCEFQTFCVMILP